MHTGSLIFSQQKQKLDAKTTTTSNFILQAIISDLDSNERVKIVGKEIDRVFDKIASPHIKKFRKFLKEYEHWQALRNSALDPVPSINVVADPKTGGEYYQRAVVAMAKVAQSHTDLKIVWGIIDDLISSHAAYRSEDPTSAADVGSSLLQVALRLAWLVDQVPLFVVSMDLEKHRNLRSLVIGILLPSQPPIFREISRVLSMYKILKTLPGYSVHESPLHLLASYYVHIDPKIEGPLKGATEQRVNELRALVQPALTHKKARKLAEPILDLLRQIAWDPKISSFIQFLETQYQLEDSI
jgi:hypothetical protein